MQKLYFNKSTFKDIFDFVYEDDFSFNLFLLPINIHGKFIFIIENLIFLAVIKKTYVVAVNKKGTIKLIH